MWYLCKQWNKKYSSSINWIETRDSHSVGRSVDWVED